MKKLTKKITIATALLCGGLLASVGFGNVNAETALAAEGEQVQKLFEVKSASLRIPDATYGEGIRFKIVMDTNTYTTKNVANLTTGVLVIPTGALGENELTASLENAAMKKVEGVTWSVSEEDANLMEMYVHLYNIPDTEYATEVSIRAYVNGTDLLTDVATSSVAEAADWLYDNDTTLTTEEKASLQATYLTYDVFFHNGDNVTEADGIYGEKITAPTAPEKEGYTFDGWWNNGYTTEWDFATTTIGGVKTNLYAKWDINEYSVTVIRADGTQKVEKFTVENRDTVLAGIKLTDNTAQYTYAWETALPSELALNDTQVFTETRTVNKYTVTLVKANGEANQTLTDIPYGTEAAAIYAENMIPTYAGRTFDGWYLGDVKVEETDIVESDLTLTAKWTVADKITLIDAATQASLFSNTYVVSTDAKGQMDWGAGKGTTYATTTDETYGSVIETNNASAYIMGWINFNTGIEGDLKSYWDYKLAGLDKIVFYAYNGTALPHAISVKSADGALGSNWFTLNANGWTKIVLDTDLFVGNTGAFANIAVAGNAYIKIHFKNADGSNNGGPGNTTFKFSNFYGYTEKGYEDEFLKTATVLDAETDIAKFAKGRVDGNNYWVDMACQTEATFETVDTEYGKGVKMVVTSNSPHGAYIDFNTGVEDQYAYWAEKLAGLDKIVFYYYNGTTVATSIGLRGAGGSPIHSGSAPKIEAGVWVQVVIDVNTFLTNLKTTNRTYIMFADTGSVTLNKAEFIVTSFVGYTNLAYEKAFPTA